MILDYSEFISRSSEKGIVNFVTVEKNIDLFYSVKGECPFCHKKIESVIFEKSKHSVPDWLYGTFDEHEIVVQCSTCGWWEYTYSNSSDAILDGIRAHDLNIKTSVLKKYDESSKQVPINILNDYIYKNPEKIYDIHHKKMEELVQSIFIEYYNCEVELVGKSHDGGKDLIMINSDSPTIVQIKRRTQADKVEPVSSIRELLGVTMLSGSQSCIFVTTADHFSRMAVQEAQKAKELYLVNEYDLVDYHRFIEMLQLKKKTKKAIWKTLIQLK